MLKCYIIDSPDQKEKLFSQFLSENHFWIVNDLESKFWVQRFLLRATGPIIHSDSVKRASEVWEILLNKIDPGWQSLSNQMAELLVEKWVGEILPTQSLNISPKDTPRAYATIGQILPLLSHFQGEDVIGQWFMENEEAKERWADWYQLGRLLWSQFLQNKLIPQEWMKGVLINEELPSLFLRSIVVDIGLDLDDVESELLLNLSRHHDVSVIVPNQEKDKEAYLNLINRCQPEIIVVEKNKPQFIYKKLPSMLAEVKEAVGQARNWLEQGFALEEIAIVSPQIENYWPTLQEHLKIEGIPAKKPLVTPMSQMPNYQDLLSRIRLACEKILSGDGEQLIFKKQESPLIDYRSFQGAFTHIYRFEDFSRNEEVYSQLPKGMGPNESMSIEEFMSRVSRWISGDSLAQLEELVENLDEIFQINEHLPVEKWLQFFERYFSRSEKQIQPAPQEGLSVLPLKASQNISIKKAIVIGLAESQLLENENTALTWLDVESIKLNFGFNLSHADRHVTEDHLKWFESKTLDEIVFTHGETDFGGRYQSPSLYWLKGAIESGHDLELQSPVSTRWDECLNSQAAELSGLSTKDNKKVVQFIGRDQGESPVAPVCYNNLSLSASSFEEFHKCPFKLFARKGLGLGNPPILDLDIDYMTRGRLLHRICEVVVRDKKFHLKDEEIYQLIDQAREDIEMEILGESLWKFLRPYYFHGAKAFIEFERQWRQDYPKTETMAVEMPIKTFIKTEGESFGFDNKGGVPFGGIVDRVDQDSSGRVVIIDYKSSDSGLTQYKSWLKNGRVQLALYSLALIEGAVSGKKHDVVGAFYFALKSLDRSKGFSLQDLGSDFLPSKKMQREELEDLLDQTKLLVGRMLQDILAGIIQPQPQNGDLRICDSCDWKRICRYPELNH